MADISKITLPNGVTYNIKDETARAAAAHGVGLKVVSTLPTAAASTIGYIYLVAHSHGTGDAYDEYVTVKGGTDASPTYTWEKIGNTDVDLSDYSHKDHTHTATVRNIEDFSNGDALGLPTGTAYWFNTQYTPTGTVSQPTFSGSELTSSGKFTPSGTVSTPTISPAVKNTSGTDIDLYSMSSAGSYTASQWTAGSYTASQWTAGSYTESSYTPESYSVTNETLAITASSYTKESVTMPSYTKESVTMPSYTKESVTLPGRTKAVISATSSQPTFTGTEGDISAKGTPSGTVSQPTFTGNARYFKIKTDNASVTTSTASN